MHLPLTLLLSSSRASRASCLFRGLQVHSVLSLWATESSSFLLLFTHSLLGSTGCWETVHSVSGWMVCRENVCNRCPLVFSLSPDSRTLNNGLSFRCSFIEFHSSLPFSLTLLCLCLHSLAEKHTNSKWSRRVGMLSPFKNGFRVTIPVSD